jgi:hypothetical protein
VTPDAGWVAFWPFPETGPNVSFVSTGPTGGRLRVAYFKRSEDDRLVGEAWIDRIEGRKVHTRARLVGTSGEVMAEGSALCVVLGDEHMEKLKAHHRAWKRNA